MSDTEDNIPEGVVRDPIRPDAEEPSSTGTPWGGQNGADEEPFDPDTGEVLNDRGISSVGGNPGANKKLKTMGIAAFVAGCGIVAVLTVMNDGKPPKAAPLDTGPVKQTVPFEGASGPPPLPPTMGDPEAEAAILAGDSPRDMRGDGGRDREPEVDPRIKKMEDARRSPITAFGGGMGGIRGGGAGAQEGAEGGGANRQQPGLVSSMFGAREANEFEKLRETSTIGRAQAYMLPNRNWLITAGTQIPCILQTAMDTATPGFVSCLIARDVYSDNGQTVVMEKGTRVLGEYRGGLRPGQKRMFVVWNRAVTPKGVALDLGSPAADTLGRAGMSGQVETFFWERFSGAVLLSVVDDAVAIAARQNQDTRNTVNQSSDAATVALENSINIPPVLRKRQGEEVSIFAGKDFDFSSVYGLRLR